MNEVFVSAAIAVLPVIMAFLLDFIFGDPYDFPHFVRLMGRIISFGEKLLLNENDEDIIKFIKGGLLSLSLVLGSFALILAALKIFYGFHFLLGFSAETFLCYQAIAAKSLKIESMKVYEKLEKGHMEGARLALSMIVGRDTADLDSSQIAKAAVETVAENTSDGVIAPIFFMILGGAPLGVAYKAANTLDSMIGYNNKKYGYFGKFAARLDDILNFIPARISGILMILSGFFPWADMKMGLKIYLRDRKNHLSPNSAQTESACAGLLGIGLGGGSFYDGKFVEKASIGENINEIRPIHIKYANMLMYTSSIMGLMAFSAAKILARGLFL